MPKAKIKAQFEPDLTNDMSVEELLSTRQWALEQVLAFFEGASSDEVIEIAAKFTSFAVTGKSSANTGEAAREIERIHAVWRETGPEWDSLNFPVFVTDAAGEQFTFSRDEKTVTCRGVVVDTWPRTKVLQRSGVVQA